MVSHAIGLRGTGYHRALQASGRADLQGEEPVAYGDCASFHVHPAEASVLGAPLIRHQVVQVGEPRAQRSLAPAWVVQPLHRASFPLDGVVSVIQQGASH